jgi:hypothetical protein
LARSDLVRWWVVVDGCIKYSGKLLKGLGLLISKLGKRCGWLWMEERMDEVTCRLFGGIGRRGARHLADTREIFHCV